MLYNPIDRFFSDRVIYYEDLGDISTGGIYVDTLIERLEGESKPATAILNPSKMFPFVLGSDEKVHPAFKEDCDYKDPFCFGYEYEPTQASLELFENCFLEIFIVDQLIESGICHLCFRYDKLCPEGWEAIEDFCLMRSNLEEFIQLLRRIQHASLSELLA